jgi:hypothetical protein
VPTMPHLAETFHVSELGRRYSELRQDMVRLCWHINGHQLDILHATLLATLAMPTTKVSPQDCLTAYFVTALNRCADVVIRKVTNAAGVSVGSYPKIQHR